MESNNAAFTLPVFPLNDRVSQDWAQVAPRLERLHDDFMGQWRQALSAIVPANVEIDVLGTECKTYAQFVKEAPAFSDIQVYEIESLQSLCAWSLDVGFVSGAVDSMFGGTGRALVNEVQRRSRSPIESGIRRRLLESLATAYESVWQVLYPIRLNPLRQEALVSSLRLTSSSEHVVHARFVVCLGHLQFAIALCLPLRALDILQPKAVAGSAAGAELPQGPAEPSGAAQSVPARLQETPVEVVAMIGDLQLTVAQLMSLSIGQVVPFEMSELIALQVDGVRVASGRSGTRHGRHAVKVDLSAPVNWPMFKSDFTPLAQGLSSVAAESAQSPVPEPSVHEHAQDAQNNTDQVNHESQPSE